MRFNLKQMNLGKLSQHDHHELLEMAGAGDVDATIEALTHHLNRGVEAINAYLGARRAEEANPAAASRERSVTQ